MTRQPIHCRGPVDRRTWLSVGGISWGRWRAAGCRGCRACWRRRPTRRRASHDFSVILFWANGGPSHIDLFDLKPAAPAEYRGPFRPIRTSVPGMEINELLPRLAKLADKFTLIRSLHHERNEHSGGTHRFLTGYASRAANLNDAEFPEIGSIVAEQGTLAERHRGARRHVEQATSRRSSPIRSSTAAGRPTSGRPMRRTCPAPTRSPRRATTPTIRFRSIARPPPPTTWRSAPRAC